MKTEKKSKQKEFNESIKKKNKDREKKRIKLETESDLYNLPINTLKNTKIYNFYGKYYDEIYNKAIQMEKEGKKNNQSLSKQKKPPKKILINIKRKFFLRRNPISLKKQIYDKDNNRYSQTDSSINTSYNNSINDSYNNSYNNIISNTLYDNSINQSYNFNNSLFSNNIYANNNLIKRLNISNITQEDLLPDLSSSAVITNFPTIRQFEIKSIDFRIKYDTQIGESLAIIGSLNELGLWKQNKALKMEWNEGNIWKALLSLNIYNNNIDFEYKFIVLDGGKIKCWENGNNRKFIISQISELVRPYIENYDGENNIIYINNVMNQSFEYDTITCNLSIICSWNKN